MLIKTSDEVLEDFVPAREFKGSDPFRALLNGLADAANETDDGRIWVSDTVFMMEYYAADMYPTIKQGAIIWVDTAQVPVIGKGIVDGYVYLIKGFHKLVAPHLMRVQVSYRDGTWGRLYWTEWSEAKGDEREFVPLPNKEDHLKENSRYIGRVIGSINPV